MCRNASAKRTSFWKYLVSAIVIMLGISCNTEARVTKEVAEATIIYLLEAVGIPPTGVQATDNARRDAIVHMLYTDDGQREMVDWAKNGNFPPILTTAGFAADNLYLYGWLQLPLIDAIQTTNQGVKNIQVDPIIQNMHTNQMLLFAAQAIRDSYIRTLFPCGPGTFSSFAAHPLRLGYHVLNNNGANLVGICLAVIENTAPITAFAQEVQDVINRLRQYDNIDNKLARVLFVLDICDTSKQVFDILDTYVNAGNIIAGYQCPTLGQAGTRAIPINNRYNEYDHRPVSATYFPNGRQGDCVETLYRHLINIATQNERDDARLDSYHEYNIGHLPDALKNTYYGSTHVNAWNPVGSVAPDTITIPVIIGEAGLTKLATHNRWKTALQSVANVGNISNGTITDIVRVLYHVCPLTHGQPNMGRSGLGMRAGAYPAQGLTVTIQSSIGVGGGTDQRANADAIRDALNALDGRCNNTNRRFLVSVTDDPAVIGGINVLPQGTDLVIQIVDKLWNRRITIAARTAGTAQAHAEITEIEMIP